MGKGCGKVYGREDMSAWLLGPLSGSRETDLSLFLGLRGLDIAGESF